MSGRYRFLTITKCDTTEHTDLSIDEYLRERLMPVEGSIPHISGIEIYGNSLAPTAT
jgi:hypothetical protein